MQCKTLPTPFWYTLIGRGAPKFTLFSFQFQKRNMTNLNQTDCQNFITHLIIFYFDSAILYIKFTYLRVTPPILVRSIQWVFRRYAVRNGSVRSTQKSCYIVGRHQFLLLKCPIFIKKHNKHDIQSKITLNFLLARSSCAF